MKKIIAYHILVNSIYTSLQEKHSKAPYLDWLVKHEEKDSIHMFYHLDHAVANLCKMIELDEKQLKQLWIKSKKNKDGKSKIYIRGLSSNYTLSYVPGKMFSIDRGAGISHQFMIFGDVQRYEKGRLPRTDEEIFAALKRGVAVSYKVLSAITDICGVKPLTIISPIRNYQKAVLSKKDLPTDDDVHEDTGLLAYECCKGGWTEAFSKGHWDMVYDYDLNAAYNAVMLGLIDPRDGRWERQKGNELDGALPVDAVGFYRCAVDMTAEFHPILYADSKDRSFTPVGKWSTVLTLQEIRFIEKWKLGHAEIIDGWTFWPDDKRRYPLRKLVKELYEYRRAMNGSIAGSVAKSTMVGIYGKMLEVERVKVERFGPLYNTVWAAQIETNTRLRVAEFALEHGFMPLHVAVDGLVTDREVKVEGSVEIGQWKLSTEAPALIVGSGAVAIQGKQGDGDFSLDYDWVMEQIGEEPGAQYIEMENESVLTVGKKVMGFRGELGSVESGKRSLILNAEVKRCYVEEPRDFGELSKGQFRSFPWDISILEGMALA